MWRTFLAFSLLLLLGFAAVAHEFWLQPDRYYFKNGESALIHFRVGENFIGEAWKVKPERIIRLQHHSSRQTRDLQSILSTDSMTPVQIPLTVDGTHVVVMESTPAFIAMDGKKFTEYLEEDGIDDVLWQRKRNGTSADSASELYSRHAKLLLQCGSATDDHYKKIFGLPLEIIPEKNPALLKKGDPVSFKILYEGKPLFGAKVKVWNRYQNRTSVQNIFSQQDGRIETHVSNPGDWMVSVVKMIPSNDPKAGYRSYWGTLVFGVR